jgi:hypothetical protein
VQADDVGLREEGVELLEANAERLLFRRRRPPDVEVADLGVERLEPLCNLPADGAQPHERDERAPELPGLEPRVTAGSVPLAAAELRLPLGQPPEHGQHQEQRELGHGHRVGAGGDGHRDPPGPRRRQVDLVDADPPLLDEPEPGRGIHEARGDGRDSAHEERRTPRQRQPVGGIGRRGHAELHRRRTLGRDDGADRGVVRVEEDHDRPRHG